MKKEPKTQYIPWEYLTDREKGCYNAGLKEREVPFV